MNIQESIYLPRFITCPTSNFCGALNQHLVKNLQLVSSFIRQNQIALAISAFGINFTLMKVTEKIISLVSEKIKFEFWQKAWVQQAADLVSKSIVAFTGLALLNRFAGLHLSALYMSISVISTLAFQALWNRYVSPELTSLCTFLRCRKSDVSTEETEEDETDPASEELSPKSVTPVEKKEEVEENEILEETDEVKTEEKDPVEKPQGQESSKTEAEIPTSKLPIETKQAGKAKKMVDIEVPEEVDTGSLAETAKLQNILEQLENLTA